MSKYGLISFNKDSFIMETDESIEIADFHVRFNAYGSTIDAEGDEEEEIVEDEEVDRCNHFMPIQIVENSSL